jgi:hypothetical protein
MKTTVEISDALFHAVKKKAANDRRSVRDLIESGLRRELARRSAVAKGKRRKLRLVTTPGGLPPDLDVTSREAIYAWLLKRR